MTDGARKGERPGSRGVAASDRRVEPDLVTNREKDGSAGPSGTPATLPRLLWAQELPTADGTPYLRRWVVDLGFGSVRLHHWLCSDDDRAPHDHPYWMITFIFKGGYTDVEYRHLEQKVIRNVRSAPSIRFWRAEHMHYVDVPDECWSLCITGRQNRVWGFLQMRGDGVRRWVRSSRYFRRVGAHPCDR